MSITVYSVHLGSQLGIKMIALGNGVLMLVCQCFLVTWSLILHFSSHHLPLYHLPPSFFSWSLFQILRVILIWVENVPHVGGSSTHCNCNTQVYVTLMELSCGGFLDWNPPCYCHFGELHKTAAFSSWWWSLGLQWKILNNRGSLTLAQLIYESCRALYNPFHPLFSFLKRPPNFVHASLGTLALNLSCMAFWLSLEGVSRFRNMIIF